jgi:LAO/AO transport system kinase
VSRKAESPDELVARAREGEARAIGRLISQVEDGSPLLRDVMAALAPYAGGLTGGAHIVGLTGSPGVGKSTSTNALVSELRRRELRVGVLAVDPSSPYSGGALLGDRIRMSEHATDPGVFIRSMAARGRLGGTAEAAADMVLLLDAAGFDTVLIETVGVGQGETEIARLAACTVVVLVPGMGDEVQAIKAGIMEIADVYVLNKADYPGIERLEREVSGSTSAPVVRCVATEGRGITEALAAIDSVFAKKTEERNS